MERPSSSPLTLGLLLVLSLVFNTALPGAASAVWKENGNPICTAPGDQFSVAACPDGGGGAVITWYNGGVFAQRVDVSGMIMWQVDGIRVSAAPASQLPDIISDGEGGAIISWNDLRSGGNPDIYAQRLNPAGGLLWPAEGVPVCTTTCSERCRSITTDGAGGAIITWCDDRRAGDCDVYAQRIDSAGRVRWEVNGVPVCAVNGAQEYPQIVPDGAGGAVIAWADFRSGTAFWIYAQRVDETGKVLWPTEGVPICTSAGSKLPRMASDGAGGAIITWRDPRRTTNYDMYAQRVSAEGKALWQADGIPICTAAGAKWWPLIASDGNGGAIILWRDYRDATSYNTYAQRVDPSGKTLWKKNGNLVCAGEYNERYHDLAADGEGGAIVSWYEERLSGTYDIYAQRINQLGRPIWKSPGVVVCSAPEDQQFPVVAPDSNGGAIIAWDDFRSGTNLDVYAQRVRADGSVGSSEGTVKKPRRGPRK